MTPEQRAAAHADLMRAIGIATKWIAEFWEADFELSMGLDEPHVCRCVEHAHLVEKAAA